MGLWLGEKVTGWEGLIMNDAGDRLTRVEVAVKCTPSCSKADEIRQKAYALMKDVESYPEYMSSVNEVKILKRKENKMTTLWDADIDGVSITWIQDIETVDESREMIFETFEGDFDVFKGRWSVTESDGKVELRLLIEYRFGIPIIEDVLEPILKKKFEANSKSMLEALAAQL